MKTDTRVATQPGAPPAASSASTLSPPNDASSAPLPPNHAARATFVGGRWFSFRAALNGAVHTLRTQPNAWIEVAALAVVVTLGVWLQIRAIEWALLGLTIFLILALEAVNTAIEAVVDMVQPDWHMMAGRAKDAAAGALIFAVIGSLAVAAAIFGPRLIALLR